jgi:hypothetical protein
MASLLSPRLVGLVALLASLAPAVARADAAADAKDLFARGRDLRAHGDCANAIVPFRKAYELYPSGLGSLRNLAECEEQVGQFASSRRAWLDLKRALVTEDAHKYDGWSQDADQAAARLAPKLATITIDVNAVGPDGSASDPKAIEVTLDGEAVPLTLLGSPLERDPGRHVVRAAGARVHDPQQKAVDVRAGGVQRVALRVVVTPEKADPNDAVALPAPAGAGAPAGGTAGGTAGDDAAERGRAMRRTLGWVAVGVGGASLVGAAIALAVRQSALADVNAQCPGYSGCPASLQGDQSKGQTAAVLFDVLGPLGLVATGAGVALVLTSGEPPQRAGWTVTPRLGGATATWRF